jgi:hypothetical protein
MGTPSQEMLLKLYTLHPSHAIDTGNLSAMLTPMTRPRIHLGTLLIVTMLAAVSFRDVFAAEQPSLSDVEKAKATELIKNLGADDFDVRTNAAEELSNMHRGIASLLRETVVNTEDSEVKIQVAMILKNWALEIETDPAVLSKYGREEALAKHYAEAVPYYEKAAKLYVEATLSESDLIKKNALQEEAQKATERSKLAAKLFKLKAKIDTDAMVRLRNLEQFW